jgi:hypothetical protein
MNKLHLRIGSAALAFASLLSAVPSRSRPQLANATASEIVLAIDPAQSKVHWTADSTLHTVHGTFARAAKIRQPSFAFATTKVVIARVILLSSPPNAL